MFTGIVTDVGRVVEVERRGDARLKIECAFDLETVDIGASISCAGVCLTVTEKDPAARWFAIDASAETQETTTLGDWSTGRRINLERALRVGDELGGHIVTGHVDGIVDVVETRNEGDSLRVTFAAPQGLGRFIASKGSVALDGCSLTVNEVADGSDGTRFGVNLIPHTRKWTSFDDLAVGARLNLEIDVLARYVARLNAAEES